jgi:hypothetical protein
MSEYHGSYLPSPDQPEPAITWHDQVCLICGRGDVTWAYRLGPVKPSAAFALPHRVYLCDVCQALLDTRDDGALADRLRSVSGEWPIPEDVVLVLRNSLMEDPVRR